jgi:two-component system response regulator PilR (NtrC family)
LRERREDISLLARTFLERFRKSMNKQVSGISPEAMQILEAYDWPGNVRELENTIERSVALESGDAISAAVLPEKLHRKPHAGTNGNGKHSAAIPPEGIGFEERIAEIEKSYLNEALKMSDGVGTHAADLLKITYRSFRHYTKKYNL